MLRGTRGAFRIICAPPTLSIIKLSNITLSIITLSNIIIKYPIIMYSIQWTRRKRGKSKNAYIMQDLEHKIDSGTRKKLMKQNKKFVSRSKNMEKRIWFRRLIIIIAIGVLIAGGSMFAKWKKTLSLVGERTASEFQIDNASTQTD